MDVPEYLQNHEAVLNFFGRWPSFHDAYVMAYEWAGDAITFTLHTWLMTNEVDDEGYYILKNHALVAFRFEGLHDVDLDEFGVEWFGSKNILFGLEFSRTLPPAEFHVELDSVMDMSGAFSARRGQVLSVAPCTEKGVPIVGRQSHVDRLTK